MTFRVFPLSSACGGFKIYGQRTKNMRYDRPNFFAAFDLSTEAYATAGPDTAGDTLLRSVVADLEGQLRKREQ